MRFTKIPENAFENIQLNAGILVDAFNVSTGEIGNILGATSGGFTFNAVPTYKDYGEDIDNCPKNTMEMKKVDDWDVKGNGTFASLTKNLAQFLIGPASVTGNKITPLRDVLTSHFKTLWWIGDYSDKNGAENGGFIAIKMINSLSTGGFKLVSSDKEKGKFDYEFTCHNSMASQSTVPFEVYIQEGSAEDGDYIMNVISTIGSTSGKTDISTSESAGSGESYVYMTGYGLYAPAQGMNLSGSAWTSWNGSDEITATTGMDIVVAIKDADGKAVHAGITTVVSAE